MITESTLLENGEFNGSAVASDKASAKARRCKNRRVVFCNAVIKCYKDGKDDISIFWIKIRDLRK
jgi:hypothetical protein